MSQSPLPSVPTIVALQSQLTKDWHSTEPNPAGEALLRLVADNHFHNFSLWHEEDIARRDDIPAERVKQAKRAIDRHNQLRNNFIEAMDKVIIPSLPEASASAPQHSETPGMIIDRLSILALKEYHMREETERGDASEEHRQKCGAKLAVISVQRQDLAQCLETLLDEVRTGRRRIKVYYQFKMYNDPSLNPQLYRAAEEAKA